MASQHGGRIYDTIGDRFENLDLRSSVVSADVLDAWFDPAPGVTRVLEDDAEWLCKTSPPADARALEAHIAEHRSVDSRSVLCGHGSSDLIYRALIEWLTPSSRILVLDPTYSEYRYISQQVVGCSVTAVESFEDAEGLFDLIIVVNPNNPTGELFSREHIVVLRRYLSPCGRIFVDEAYLPFVGAGQSVQSLAPGCEDIVVCQSLSKSFALSGLRAAYLVGHVDTIDDLRQRTPPWSMSLPATIASHTALDDPEYYQARYEQTRILRHEVVDALSLITGVRVESHIANWVCCRVDASAKQLVASCAEEGVLIRDGGGMFVDVPADFVRIAVRSKLENSRVVSTVAGVMARLAPSAVR